VKLKNINLLQKTNTGTLKIIAVSPAHYSIHLLAKFPDYHQQLLVQLDHWMLKHLLQDNGQDMEVGSAPQSHIHIIEYKFWGKNISQKNNHIIRFDISLEMSIKDDYAH